jgi:hypothetical protein
MGAHLEDLIPNVSAGPLERHAVALDGHHGGVEAGAEGGGADALAHNVGACANARNNMSQPNGQHGACAVA